MGGSILGTEAIYDFLNFKIKKKINFYNNLDGKIKLTDDAATQNTRVVFEQGETVICKLDSMQLNDADMLKIDVEGLEMQVLQGAENLLDNIEFVMIELNNNSKRYGSSNGLIQKHMRIYTNIGKVLAVLHIRTLRIL